MMNRKKFIANATGLTAGLLLPVRKLWAEESDPVLTYKKPPYLKPGDTIGITSPAGFTTLENMKSALEVMESWGFKIKIGDAIGKRDFSFGGTDEERLKDLQQMLDDPKINAIMAARGGYGVVRIVDRLNWAKFKQHPKWLIGFSDITVLHSHIHRHCHVATIHSKMTNSFPDFWMNAEPVQRETIISIQDVLVGKKMHYTAEAHVQNRTGLAEGILVGGNLKLLESMAGTASDINTTGKILFVEDTGEYLYSLDRMFWNLKRTGKLSHLKGLIVGGFRIKADDPGEEFGRTLQDIVLEKVKSYKYPVCFDFPVGHQRANYAYKLGVKHQLIVNPDKVVLKET